LISFAGLAALDLAAALFVWRSFVATDGGHSLPARNAPMLVPAGLTEVPKATEGDDHETLARPLFVKSRRPSQVAPRAANGASAAPPPAGLKLRAIIGFDRWVRAFVTSSAAVDGKWVSVGEIFENWRVESISPQEIALRQDSDTLRVGLDYDGAPAPVGPAPALPPPAKTENAPARPPSAVSYNLDDEPAPKIVAPDTIAAVKGAGRGGH
jgi:hypothetical protein